MALNSPTTYSPIFDRPAHQRCCNSAKSIRNATDAQYRSAIFGPWYWFAVWTGMLVPVKETSNKFFLLVQFLPNALSTIILLIRANYFVFQMGNAHALTLEWAKLQVIFFTALHGFISCAILTTFKRGRFVEKMVQYMRNASLNRMSKAPIQAFFSKIIVVLILVIPVLIYVMQVWLTFNDTFSFLSTPEGWQNASAEAKNGYRLSLAINIVDSILVIWGTIPSAAVLILYLLANATVCREYRYFRKEFKAHVKDGTITQLHIIKSFQSQLIDFLTAACYLNNVANGILNITFMAGLMCQIASQYALHSYSSELTPIQLAWFSFALAQSIAFLVYSMRRPGLLQNELTKTTYLVMLDQGIWQKSDDALVKRIAKNIAARLKSVDYTVKGAFSSKAANTVFIAVMIIIPFFVNILAGYKPISEPTNSTSH
uniref:Gustatory receptor n=1 Tax=Panagrellus redivivus TaxID=6233 RepID=A0A7E4V7X5_PANRE